MATVYVSARAKTTETGIPHEVDHIIPLKGRNICGLHVPWNLRVVTGEQNKRKRNSYTDSEMSYAGFQ